MSQFIRYSVVKHHPNVWEPVKHYSVPNDFKTVKPLTCDLSLGMYPTEAAAIARCHRDAKIFNRPPRFRSSQRELEFS